MDLLARVGAFVGLFMFLRLCAVGLVAEHAGGEVPTETQKESGNSKMMGESG